MVKYDLRILATITNTTAYDTLTTYIRTQVDATNIHQELYDSTTTNKANIIIHSDSDPTAVRTNIKGQLDTMVSGGTCTAYEIKTIEFADADSTLTYP